jgi:hypothetical protein
MLLLPSLLNKPALYSNWKPADSSSRDARICFRRFVGSPQGCRLED